MAGPVRRDVEQRPLTIYSRSSATSRSLVSQLPRLIGVSDSHFAAGVQLVRNPSRIIPDPAHGPSRKNENLLAVYA